MKSNKTYRVMVAIETDATQYHGPHATRPRLLGKNDADQMLAHLAADLSALFPDIRQCNLVAPGAMFDQTQILRQGYPVYSALEQVINQSRSRVDAGLVSVGSSDQTMPVDELQPDDTIPLGLLQLIPLVIDGPAERVDELGMGMEQRFMEEGQVSAHTAKGLESAFGIAINHARFMTLTDLNAMFRLQLEHFGFLPLWELLDAALNGHTDPLQATAANGQVFQWKDGVVQTRFETFDFWAGSGEGKASDTARGRLAGGYADWTRIMRQYLTTLSAHGVPVRFHLPKSPDQHLEGTYFAEPSRQNPPAFAAAVTEHSFSELGTICITVVSGDEQTNYYPLAPQGLMDIHAAIRKAALESPTVAFPGTIMYDEAGRALVADTDRPQNIH